MLELQEQQHKRIVMLSGAALVFACFATWQLFSDVFSGDAPGAGYTNRVYLLCCITLMIAAIVVMLVRSFQDYRAIKTSELYDDATGLPSRASLERQAGEEIERLRPGEMAALILLDIRRFKSLNHSFGYQTGDKILQAVAERLRSLSTANRQLFKMEGDCFAYLMAGVVSPGELGETAASVQRALVPPFMAGEKSIYIDLSIGCALAGEGDKIGVTELLRRAEFALAEAKTGDGKRHVIYSDKSAATAKRTSTMETGLREALEAGGLEIYYQPLIESRFEKIVAVEALARWTHPQLGRISPTDFVRIAESLGLVHKLGSNILRRACKQILPLGGVKLAVNISPRHFMSPGFVEEVAEILRDTGFPADRLEIEVTESVLITENEAAGDVIDKLRAMGVSMALDDFGTGYNGLSYLSRFALDRIKIDASFVREIENSVSAQSMVSTIIHLARDRGLHVTVEGVETTGQVLFLSRFENIWYQGFLFARPMPYQDLMRTGSLASMEEARSLAKPPKAPVYAPAISDEEWLKKSIA